MPRDAAKSVRSRLYWVAALLLAGAALLAGMLVEWMRPGPQGLGSPSTLLALAALGGSLVLGVSIARRMAHSPSASRNNAGDARAVLAFIWWPITVVSVAVPLFVVYISTQNTYGEGTGVPTGITLILGVFGFIILPAVVNESRAAFAGRGLRGFWRAAKNTPWGDGI